MKKILALVCLMLVGCADAESRDGSVLLNSSNVLVLDSQVDEVSVAKVMQEALTLDGQLPKGKPLYLVLSTPGGSVDSGLALISMLKGLDRPVHTITIFAASMGFQIAQGLSDRLIVPDGMLMSHRAKGGIQGEFAGQEGSQLEKRMKMVTDVIQDMDKKTVARTKGKKTLKQYQAEYENELWLLSEKAVSEGYADKVVLPRCAKDLNGTKESESSFLGMRIAYRTSKCPLVRGILEMKVTVKNTAGNWVPLDEFVAKGGAFGPNCVPSSTQQCALDPNLNVTKIENVKQELFEKSTVEWKKRNIVFKI